jgi:hypothetical protein
MADFLTSRSVAFSFVLLVGMILFPGHVSGAAVFYGPSSYLSFSNSPFSTQQSEYFYLETFEDSALNTPGAFLSSGWVITSPGPLIDSVDGDDGIIDGSGTNGHSLFSIGSRSNLTVFFNPAFLGGRLPTCAGIVCTDIGSVTSGQLGVGNVTFSARDGDGAALGSIVATNLGNGSAAGSGPGATAEDRFFGVSNPAGISSISITANNSTDWELDHLQYGYYRPQLRIQHVNSTTAVLAWSTNAVGYELQEINSLTETNWTDVPDMPAYVGADNQVTVTPLSSNRFYRLIAQ